MTDNELEGIRVKSAIADKNQLTLYLENGDVRTVKQGDPRLPALIDQIMPIVARGEVAVISLQSFSVYAAFEEKTNGLVKFFKVAKKALGGWFGKHTDEKELILPPNPNPTVSGTPAADQALGGYVPGQAAAAPVAAQSQKPEVVRKESTSRVDELSQPTPVKTPLSSASTPAPSNASLPATAQPMQTEDVADDETVVAVIDGMVIPEIEKVKPYLIHALKHNGQDAVIAFLRRIIPMLDKRQHSIQDLLRFMQGGDLPIADDGSMIAYKILRKKNGHYVDCHTGKVQQKIGSYVTVDEKLVDLNRHNECSNGLHVARRAYIGGFGGDVVTLIKVAPEDVITVPHRDANKVRTKGYHILAELSSEAYDLLKQNKSATKTGNTSELLAKILRGDHVAKLEKVRITQQAGNGVVITQLEKGKKPVAGEVTDAEHKKAQSLDPETAAQVNPKEINQKIEAEKQKIAQEAKAPETVPPEKEIVKPTKSLDIQVQPDIQQFIATFGGSYKLANFVKDHVSKGGDPHRALSSNALVEFRNFANDKSKDVFNEQVKEIFKAVAPKPPKAKKPVTKKAPAPEKKTAPEPKAKTTKGTKAEKPKVPEAKKPAPKKTTTKVVNDIADKAKSNTKPTPKANAKSAVPVTSQAPAQVKSSEKKNATAVSAKPVDKVVEVLKLYDAGKGTTEISKLTGVPRSTLSGWINKHRPKK